MNEWVRQTLNDRAKYARELRQRLYFEPFPLNKADDAERYLRLDREYNYIVDLFREMQCYNWLNDDFDIGAAK